MLNRKTYFIREHTGVLELTNAYDILDPETQEQIGIAKEKPENLDARVGHRSPVDASDHGLRLRGFGP